MREGLHMTKDKQESGRTMSCAICGSDRHRLLACEGGYVCESCLDDHRAGRDNSTRQAKLQARARRAKASLVRLAGQGLPADLELEYQVAATRSMLDTTDSYATSSTMGAGGEVPFPRCRDVAVFYLRASSVGGSYE